MVSVLSFSKFSNMILFEEPDLFHLTYFCRVLREIADRFQRSAGGRDSGQRAAGSGQRAGEIADRHQRTAGGTYGVKVMIGFGLIY